MIKSKTGPRNEEANPLQMGDKESIFLTIRQFLINTKKSVNCLLETPDLFCIPMRLKRTKLA